MTLNFYTNYRAVGKIEWDKKISNLKIIAEMLAQRLHILLLVERISDFDAYSNEMHGALDELSSEDHLFVLDNTQKYFVERYGEEIKKSGTSLLIKDLVLHRVGKELKARTFELFAGFNVRHLVSEHYKFIYDINFTEIEATLKEKLLPNQIAEFDEYFERYPRILIANSLITNLGLVNEAQINIQAIKLLLQSRSREEIAEILIEAEILLKKLPFELIDIHKELKSKLSSNEEAILSTLLEGINTAKLAEEITDLFRNPDSAIQELNEVAGLHNDLQGLFLKSAAKQSGLKTELELYPRITKILYNYPSKIIKEVFSVLESQYGVILTEELYQLHNNFSPMRIANTIKRLADTTPPRNYYSREESYLSDQDIKEIKDLYRRGASQSLETLVGVKVNQVKQDLSIGIITRILAPLLVLNDSQVHQVCTAFEALSNIKMIEYLLTKETFISRNESSPQAIEIIRIIVTGLSTLELNYKERSAPIPIEEKIKDIANIIFQKDSISLNDRNNKLTTIISDLTQAQLISLVEYYQKTFKLSLFESLEGEIHVKLMLEIKTLILNFDYSSLAKNLSDPKYLCSLNRIHPSEAILINSQSKDILNSYKEMKDLPLVQIFLHLLTSRSKVARLRKLLTSKTTLTDEESILLLDLFHEDNSSYLKFSYNYWFSDPTLCFEFKIATLVQSLKIATNNQIIARPLFVRIILILEGLPIDLIENIHVILTHLHAENLGDFQDILIKYKEHLPLIKMVYNVLDQGSTLRDRIYDSSLDLILKNKILLILDGYNPDLVANEIYQLIENYSDKDLGEKIVRILTTQTEDPNNRRIPKAKNWTSEMYHQIRISYYKLYNIDLIKVLRNKNVPIAGLGINWIAYRLYGEVSKNVLEFDKRIKIAESDAEIEQAITANIQDLIPLLRERFINMYEAYFGTTLISQVTKKTTNIDIINKINNLLSFAKPTSENKPDRLDDLLSLLDKDLKF